MQLVHPNNPAGPLPAPVVDVAVVGSGLTAALVANAALRAGRSVGWFDIPEAGQGSFHHDPALITPFLAPFLPHARPLVETLRRSLLQGDYDLAFAWQRRRQAAFGLRHLFDRRGGGTDRSRVALKAMVDRSMDFYMTDAAGYMDLIDKTGLDLIADNSERRESLEDQAQLLKLRLAAGGDANPSASSGASQGVYLEQAWVVRSVAALADLGRRAILRHERLTMAAGVHSIRRSDEDRWAVHAEGFVFSAAQVVLLSRGALDLTAETSVRRLPIGSLAVGRRHHAWTGKPLQPIVHSEGLFSVMPTPRGALVTVSPRHSPTERAIQRRMSQILARHLPQLGEPRDEICRLLEMQTPDGLPAIGPLPGAQGLIAALCPPRLEPALAPAIAELTVAMLEGRSLGVLSDEFGVQRLMSSQLKADPARPAAATKSN
jgi:glycine/D-amino acid oxidase-like deaminating enzyme